MAGIGRVVAALRQVPDLLPFARSADALEAAEEARSLVERAGDGSGRDGFRQVAGRFGEAAEGISDLQGVLTGIQHLATAVANRLAGEGLARPIRTTS
ncbi:hypothetical protein Q5530_35010 [Saccharothrix sp. BKS2]|uniref:hypothetical protein n=1 Tax=Saccharothrix sp. BKS2 TaxID=3064400 RepID=UPI0039E7B0AA